MSKCIVKGCPGDKRMFRLPHDHAGRELWLKIVKREDLISDQRRHHVCKKHFRPEMFGSVRLNSTAIPFLEVKEKTGPKIHHSGTVRRNLKVNPLVGINNRIEGKQTQKDTLVECNLNSLCTKGTINPKYDSKKCGEILVGVHGALTLVCAMCAECFVSLETFGMHIQSQHTRKTAIPLQSPQLSSPIADVVRSTIHHVVTVPAPESNNSSAKFGGNEIDMCEDEIQSVTNKEPGMSTATQKSTTVANNKTIVCKFYDKSVTDIFKYIEHLKTHSGSIEFTCPLCPKKFNTQKKKPSGTKPKKKYKCNYCVKSFEGATEKEMHERTHFGGNPAPLVCIKK